MICMPASDDITADDQVARIFEWRRAGAASTPEQARAADYRFPVMTGFVELLWGNVLPTREEQEQLLRGAGLTGPLDRRVVGAGFTVLTTAKPT